MSASTMAQANEITDRLRKESRDNVQKIIDNFDLVMALMRGDPDRIDRRAFDELMTAPVQDIFSTPQAIFDRFLIYANRQNWLFFGTDQIEKLHDQMPTDHVSSLDHLLTLDIWLGDLPTTFEALSGWIEYEQTQIGNRYLRSSVLKSDTEHLRLVDSTRYGKTPSVHWVVLDMTANWGASPKDAENADLAGLQVMTAFAVHPAYPSAIDHEIIPGAWMGGLQATIDGYNAWRFVPLIGWRLQDRRVNLYARDDGDRTMHYAVPEVREL